MSNGGMIMGDNFCHFKRFRLADLARENPGLMDVHITRFAETLCWAELGCDRERVMAEYNITGSEDAREDLYKYKYAVDLDGTTFSGRFLELLRSGSLVFKSTSFEEYLNDRLPPFQYFVPVLPDLSDLVQKIEWANVNPAEARLIQWRGWESPVGVRSSRRGGPSTGALRLVDGAADDDGRAERLLFLCGAVGLARLMAMGEGGDYADPPTEEGVLLLPTCRSSDAKCAFEKAETFPVVEKRVRKGREYSSQRPLTAFPGVLKPSSRCQLCLPSLHVATRGVAQGNAYRKIRAGIALSASGNTISTIIGSPFGRWAQFMLARSLCWPGFDPIQPMLLESSPDAR
ncbi:hypothetical protein C8J57DRAFT_1239656 [Mycena rebaudengoi]|nr:hypothetical protein C8J57DRAFT_1239656 [Mycena rebaudengoi]